MPHVDQLLSARVALRRGEQALAGGRFDEAKALLDYAQRVAPKDAVLALTTANARLRSGDPAGAAALLAPLARAYDLREAWLALASARRLAGDAQGALTALAEALSRHCLPDGIEALCDITARDAGAVGWCGIGRGDVLRLGGIKSGALKGGRHTGLLLTIDGVAVPDAADGMALPPSWRPARRIVVYLNEQPLIGSPILPERIVRAEGFVEAWQGGVRGWAWLPGDPDAHPDLLVRPMAGLDLRLRADDLDIKPDSMPPLARPRGFSLTAAQLAGMVSPLHVLGPDGRDLYGSPLDPTAEATSARAAALLIRHAFPAAPDQADPPALDALSTPAIPVGSRGAAVTLRPAPRKIDVVIPVYRGLRETMACLDSVLAGKDRATRVVVVNDASPEADLVAALEDLAAKKKIVLLHQPRNSGFPATANAGLRHAAGRDAVLLNSDTLVPPDWLRRLRDAAYSAPDIGSVTPLSNDATIMSYPAANAENPVPDMENTIRLDRAAQAANGDALVDIPTGIGFCMYLRGDCLESVGLLREDVFAQGYGEENDFCLRAQHLGWRHVGHTGVFVGHVGGRSFGGAKNHLIRRNLAVLNRLHPGYDALIAGFVADDPIQPARRQIDRVLWHAGTQNDAVLLITHARGGGVARHVRECCDALRAEGLRPVVLTPYVPAVSGAAEPGGAETEKRFFCQVDDGLPDHGAPDAPQTGFRNLIFRMPDELPLLLDLLRGSRLRRSELHHFIGHHPVVAELHRWLHMPQDAIVHDYALFCPRISLVTGTRRYCGEPDLTGCETCIADYGSELEDDIGVAALRQRSASWLRDAARIIAPSADAGRRMARHFPGIVPLVQPWEQDRPPSPSLVPKAPLTVCVLGAIGIEKGFDVLLACARDAARRDLPLNFVVIGFSIDDQRLLDTGRVRVTGPYQETETLSLIEASGGTLGFLPSVWPETWCYTLGWMWRAGLHVLGFDLGAPAERIRRIGGHLMPLGLPAGQINDVILKSIAMHGAVAHGGQS